MLLKMEAKREIWLGLSQLLRKGSEQTTRDVIGRMTPGAKQRRRKDRKMD